MDYSQGNANWIYFVPALILVIALRTWLRGGRERDIRVERLWILPTIFAVLVALGLARQPPPLDATSLAILIVALAAGFAMGWARGRLTAITLDPETHVLKGQNSPLGLVLIAGLFLLRAVGRRWVTTHAGEWHVASTVIFDGFLLLALGVVVGRRLEILLRSLRLLAQARAGVTR